MKRTIHFRLFARACTLTCAMLLGRCHGAGAQRAVPEQPLHILVVDTQGAAIPQSRIVVSSLDPTVKPSTRTTTTDPFGAASLHLPEDSYRVTATHPGFGEFSEDFSITTGAVASLTLTLKVAGNVDSVSIDARRFKADTASSATRLAVHLLETPQQVQVLTGDLLNERAVTSMKGAVEVVPAVTLQLGEGRRDNFFIRGFNAVSDMFLDGVRDDAQYYRDLSNTDALEVVEGPAAVLYGRGSSGGLINRVTKKPRLEGTLGELTYLAGSYGEQRGTGDIDTVVPGTGRTLGFRLTGAAEHEGSQRHFYWMDRYTFAPTIVWQPGTQSVVRFGLERLRDDRLPDRGIPYLPSTGALAPVPVGNFYGYVGPGPGNNFIHSSVTGGTLDVRHTFSSGWQIHGVARKAGYGTNFLNMYATNVTRSPDGSIKVGRGEYNGTQNWNLFFSNVEVTRTGKLWGMTHNLLAGFEYDRELTDSTQFNGPANQTPVDLNNPALTTPILSTVLSRNNRFGGRTEGVYVQDLVQLLPRLKALAGVRFDNFDQALTLKPPTNTTPDLGRVDRAFSPRVGLVYAVSSTASLYANYSRTYDPSGENLSLAANNTDLKPEVTQNYETGAKTELLNQRLLVSASIFRLDRTNIKTTDPSNPLALLNLGEQRTNGAEMNIQGTLRRGWMIYGGYAWLDGRIVSSTTASNGVSLQGRRPAMNPLHSGSLWTSYEFGRRFPLHGLGLGGGLVTKHAQFAATDNLARLPSYARLDATAFYRRAKYEVQANLQNIGNIRYFDAAQSDYQIYPAAPLSGTATVRWHF